MICKIIRINILVFAIAMMLSIPAFAAGKDVDVELNKDYDACAFTITTEKYGYFDVTLTSPKKEQYFGKIDGSNTTEVLVKDVKKGTWIVNVSRQTFETQNSSEEASLEEGDAGLQEERVVNNDDTEIGKVKVSVRAIDVSSYSIDKDIKVAKDIAGLKMYFKDDNIEVEWTDTSVGNVVVTVTDTLTNVELGKETVKGNSYECALPDTTKQITVTVVPSSSARVEGAANQYTFAVDNHPDATVIYENREYVNTQTIPVTVELRDNYSVQIIVNGSVAQNVGIKPAGTYTYDIPVVEGNNSILTYIIDEDSNMRSTAYSCIRDSIEPNFKTDVNYDGKQTYSSVVTFSGALTDVLSEYESFTINDVAVKVSGDGVFKHEYELHDGANKIVFKAVDLAGNERTIEATVIKLIEEKKEIPWIPIGCGVVVLIALIIAIIRKRNDPGNGRYNNLIDGIKEKAQNKKDAPAKTADNGKRELLPWQRFFIEIIAVFVVANIIFKFVLIPGIIPSESMEPTLKTGDWGFANGLAYVINNPERGDIVIVDSDELNEIVIKRVIGLPGDTVSFYDGYVYINDGLVYEEYIASDIETNSYVNDFIVPEGCYFLLGDNRELSNDSRFWNNPYIPKNKIKGKWMTVLFHFNK